MADLQKIVDDLSKLSVLEAADLSKMLKKKLDRRRKRISAGDTVRGSQKNPHGAAAAG
jgi:ribosomal protein L7/L12